MNFVVFLCSLVATSWAAPTAQPLSSEDPASFHSETHSQSHQQGCLVESTLYSVGDRWHPTLEPFGVFYCINCTCKQAPSDSSGILSCENVEDGCPQLDCRYQYKPKHQCCRQCLNVDSDSDPVGSGVVIVDPVNPKLFRGEYLSVLTGSQMHPRAKTFAAGFGQFVVTLSTVHYLFEFHGISEIISIQIVTSDNKVAYEVPIKMHDHRICGVWSDMHPNLLDLLLDSALFVIVRTKQFPDGELFGDIFYKENEWIDSFVSLMKPHFVSNTVDGLGGGGLGMFRLNARERILEFVVTFDGVDNIEGAYFYMEMNTKEQQHKHCNRVQHLHNFTSTYKPEGQIFVGAWSNLNDTELEWLARGHLHMRIYGKSQELRGQIVVARTCGGLSAVLSGRQPPLKLSTGAGASGLFELSKDGSLTFEINWIGLDGRVTSIGFYEPLQREDESQDLEMIYNITDRINSTDIEVSGVWSNLSASRLSLLTEGNLHIIICTDRHKDGEVTGRVQRLLFNSHEKLKKELSATLSGSQMVPFQYTGIAGQVWFSLDCYCSLHYRIAVQGLSGIDYVTKAEIKGPATAGINGPVIYDIIHSFSRNLAVGLIRYPDTHFYSMIRQGFVYLEIETTETKIRGQLKLQTECWKSLYGRHRTPKPEDLRNCAHHKHGDRWHPVISGKTDYCIQCSCQDSHILCIPLSCGNVTCWDPVVIDGHCCPVCIDDDDEDLVSSSSGYGSSYDSSGSDFIVPDGFSGIAGLGDHERSEISTNSLQTGCPTDLREEGCEFGGYLYPLGLKWHPYLSQSGVMKCVICQCIQEETKAEVQCNQISCQAVECEEPVLLDDCCPSCPVDAPFTPTLTPAVKGCMLGHREYDHGETFTPYHHLVGLMECVRCNCTDGEVRCAWPCPQHFSCDNPVQRPGECCKSCPDEFHATSGPDVR